MLGLLGGVSSYCLKFYTYEYAKGFGTMPGGLGIDDWPFVYWLETLTY